MKRNRNRNRNRYTAQAVSDYTGITCRDSQTAPSDRIRVMCGNNAVMADTSGADREYTDILSPESVELLIDTEERAQEDVFEIGNIGTIEQMGFLSPLKGFMPVPDCFNNTMYARMHVKADGTHEIEYCQKYTNGTISPKMNISLSNLRLAAMYTMDDARSEPFIKKKVQKFVLAAVMDFLNKIEGDAELNEFMVFLNKLLEIKGSLPVTYDVPDEEPVENFYKRLVRALKETPMLVFDEHRAYYALDDEQIEKLAGEMDMGKSDLLKRLKAEQFLYLTKSSVGLKTNVRFAPCGEFITKSYTQWCYCILKLDYLAEQMAAK